jgi:hypothetical protein
MTFWPSPPFVIRQMHALQAEKAGRVQVGPGKPNSPKGGELLIKDPRACSENAPAGRRCGAVSLWLKRLETGKHPVPLDDFLDLADARKLAQQHARPALRRMRSVG